MKASDLSGFFLRSLFIMASLNFTRMQNLGFAYAILPLARPAEGEGRVPPAFLLRHLEYFNTHPYLSAAILGATIRLEEGGAGIDQEGDHPATRLKKALMAPYAAIGDNFFSGSLRPLAGIVAAVLAYGGVVWAPLVFLLIFTPLHLWIRIRGFLEGYRRDWQGFEFIQSWKLPRLAVHLRRISLVLLSAATAFLAGTVHDTVAGNWPRSVSGAAVLTAVLLSYYAVRRGLSPLLILYGMTAVCLVIMV